MATAILVLAAGSAVGALLLLRGKDAPPLDVRPGVAVLVSPAELSAYADAGRTPVYWVGTRAGHRLELTRTSTGTFVRYLPPDVAAGDDNPALTIATYPLANAFATATARARNAGMVSEKTQRGGLAVWSRERPASVYVAFPGVRQLIEIYSPDAGEASRLARSGRVVAVPPAVRIP